MSREAMQMALEALEDANDVARMEFSDEDYYSEAINALRQALETEQEPVAWMTHTDDLIPLFHKTRASALNWQTQPTPLYTAPQKQWVGLTDDEMEALFLNEDGVRFARYIEAKLKEKNT